MGAPVGMSVVRNILVLDEDGKRICCKYFTDDWATTQQQLQFEKSLFQKTQRTNSKSEAEIVLFENNIVVYRSMADVYVYVSGSADDNELILVNVLQTFWDCLLQVFHNQIDRRLRDHLDTLMLVIDELVDGGLIIESDANAICARVTMKSNENPVPLSEQTFSQALASAKDQIARQLLR
eukprot:GFYU01001709.1.p1 GENE.GFYU01001709.1~~GFYU01001709.1.p1  ORF type:complete len:180 (-),score=43.43 GFYU01001709.1:74-613(-)